MSRPRGDDAADAARLRGIERHLASFLPPDLLRQFWQDGFAAARQPSFRLNALRLGTHSPTSTSSETPETAACVVGGPASAPHSPPPPSLAAQAAFRQRQEDAVRQVLAGFGLDPATPVETCAYHRPARLLPAAAGRAMRVGSSAHSLGPLRSGAVYFMGLASMLPALVLMGAGGAARAAWGREGPAGSAAAEAALGGEDGGLRVLDLCAAPGGKTALLAELMGNRGTLLAVDASWPRLQRLQFNVDRLVPDHHHHHHHRHRPEECHEDRHSGGKSNLGDSQQHEQQPQWLQRRQREGRASDASGSDGGNGLLAAARGLWRRGCVVAVHADGARLRVDERGLPLEHPAAEGCCERGRSSGGSSNSSRMGAGGFDEASEREEAETGVYDRILVDAPCSGLGRLQLQRPSSYSDWDERHVGRYAPRQRQLLLRAARLLRRGGSLVYSTCTINPQENEAVVAWLLGRVGGLRLVEPRLALQGPLLEPVTAAAAATAACGGDSVSLRRALEAHRPGCTYPALIEGSTWWAAARDAAAGGSGAGLFGRGQSDGEALRNQLAACVRVAPGPTYEGFFVAQLVKL